MTGLVPFSPIVTDAGKSIASYYIQNSETFKTMHWAAQLITIPTWSVGCGKQNEK